MFSTRNAAIVGEARNQVNIGMISSTNASCGQIIAGRRPTLSDSQPPMIAVIMPAALLARSPAIPTQVGRCRVFCAYVAM